MNLISYDFFVDLAQAMANEYQGEEWFAKRMQYREIFTTKIAFCSDSDEGHFYDAPDGRVVVFRGTNSLSDWISNFDSDKCSPDESSPITVKANTGLFVHRGFQAAWKSVKKMVYDAVQKSDVVYVVGHSRGSAIAQLCSQNLKFDYPDKKIICLPFSSPRVGNKAFCDDYNGRVDYSLRVWYGSDPVVCVPLELQGYDHTFQGYHLTAPWYRPAHWFFPNPDCHYPSWIIEQIPKQMTGLFI